MIAALAALMLPAKAAGHWASQHPAGELYTPRIHVIYWLRGQLNDARRDRCLPQRRYQWRPAYRVPPAAREWVIRLTHSLLQQTRSAESKCASTRAWAWHYAPAATCVRSKEGGISSVNPAGPYYGWYQTDPSFQSAYGPEFVRAYGHGIWPAHAQVLTAWRGWSARGWYPWPNTARECGLL